jgi:hypothetical protein
MKNWINGFFCLTDKPYHQAFLVHLTEPTIGYHTIIIPLQVQYEMHRKFNIGEAIKMMHNTEM